MVAAQDYLQDFSIPPLCGRPVRDGTTCAHDDDDDDGDDFPNSEKWMAHKLLLLSFTTRGGSAFSHHCPNGTYGGYDGAHDDFT